MKRRRAFGIAAALVLFCAACIEVAIVVSGHAWLRFSTEHNDIVSCVLAGFFAICAPVILLRDRSEGWTRVAFALAVASTLALFAHSLVGLAIIYLPISFVQAYLLWNAFRGIDVEERRPKSTPHTPVRWA